MTVERTTLESTRMSLERETDSIRQEVRGALEENSTLRSKLTTQLTLSKSYEEGIIMYTYFI